MEGEGGAVPKERCTHLRMLLWGDRCEYLVYPRDVGAVEADRKLIVGDQIGHVLERLPQSMGGVMRENVSQSERGANHAWGH